MTTQERIEAIKNASQKRVMEEQSANEKRREEIQRMIDKITNGYQHRIGELIMIGECARQNTFKEVFSNPNNLRGQFELKYCTNGISHKIGFWMNGNTKNEPIRYIGVEGGGLCDYNLKISEDEFILEGSEYGKLSVLRGFIKGYEKFESDFLAVIDKL